MTSSEYNLEKNCTLMTSLQYNLENKCTTRNGDFLLTERLGQNIDKKQILIPEGVE